MITLSIGNKVYLAGLGLSVFLTHLPAHDLATQTHLQFLIFNICDEIPWNRDSTYHENQDSTIRTALHLHFPVEFPNLRCPAISRKC